LDGEKKMTRNFTKQLLSIPLSCLLIVTAAPFDAGGQQSAPTGYSGQRAPLYEQLTR
jgi:hypothetical protein